MTKAMASPLGTLFSPMRRKAAMHNLAAGSRELVMPTFIGMTSLVAPVHQLQRLLL